MGNSVAEQRLIEAEQEELALLMKMKEYRDSNLLEFFDKKPSPGPNPMQAELFDAWMDPNLKVFTYTGGNRTGKTTAGVIITVSTIIGKFLWDNKRIKCPHSKPRKVRIVGQDWEKHIKAVILPELEKWWPDSRPVKKKKNNQGIDALWIDEKTGGSIEIMSNNQDSDLHEGWQGDLIYYDEPPKRPIRVANARGLVDRQGREIFCMTLLKEAWVDREVIKATLEDGRPDNSVFNIQGDIYNNVGFGITEEGVNQFKKMLTEDEYNARILGIPSYMSGLVYPAFQRKVHLKPRFPVPLDWIVDIAIDIHPREKQAVLFCATNPRGERYIVNEIWDNGDGKWIGEQIIRCVTQNAYRVGRIIIDPLSKSDGNNESTVYEKVQNVLFRHGHLLETASKDKSSGIMEIKNHLMGPNNEPSLFIFDDLVRFLYEIEGYMWDKDTQKPCVIGNTMVDTPTGQHQIKDLVGQSPYIYCYSHNKGRIDVKKATNIRKTGKQKEVWKLTMDKGVLFATPDHLIMLRNGDYCQLKDLKPYDSLMPLYRTMTSDGYSKLNLNNGNRHGTSEHRFVYECINGHIDEGMHIHHIDGNYLNNHPDNLEMLDPTEHYDVHARNGEIVNCITCESEFVQNKPWQKHCSSKCRQKYADSRRAKTIKVIPCPICGKMFAKSSGPQKYCSVTCREINFREHRKTWPSYNKKAMPNNHKVLSVEFYGYEDVYDMEVEDAHNFVANGIVVHNCDKDDHMMENLYRLMLLNTQWSYEDKEEDWSDYDSNTRDAYTGY